MDPKKMKETLLRTQPDGSLGDPIEEATLKQAAELMSSTRRHLGLSDTPFTSIIMGLCHFAWTRAIDTFAVTLAADGNALLMVNPDFLIKIGDEQAVFALAHEAYHLLMRHLYMDPELSKNQNWTIATEACINYRIRKHLDLPLIQVDGKVAVVDPDKVYDRWRDAMKKAGLDTVSKDDFFATDIGCLGYLELCPKQLQPKGMNSCVHASGDAGSGGSDAAPVDSEQAGKLVDKVLQATVQAAKNGRPGAKEEVLAWMDASPEASQTWGDIGANTLRGETTKSRKTDLWEHWTAEALASKLREGTRWRYNRKIPWDPRVSANGRQPRKHGSVFIDTSGSMPQPVIDKIAALVGELDNIEIVWHWFDAAIGGFEAGENLGGGGGTSFHIIDEHIRDGSVVSGSGEACCEDDQDFVLVITDGYAAELVPENPDVWIWLITPGGNTWPEKYGMSCREVDLDDE
jgi:predicted metal-dependent peptidase